jgi:predicted ArsR family transcriptional regulator
MDVRSVAAIAALDDPVRAALFTFVRDASEPVSREAAAAAVGISRKLAAFHLDKLVAVGLVTSRIGTGSGRVGRAPRLYELSGQDVQVCVPAREHGTLAEILLAAVLDEHPDERAQQAVLRVARETGARMGRDERDRVRPGRIGPERALSVATTLLERHGFSPSRDAQQVVLRNCPFHPFAQTAPALVCGLNHAFLAGVLEGLQADTVEAVLAPCEGHCCVRLVAGPDRRTAPAAHAAT